MEDKQKHRTFYKIEYFSETEEIIIFIKTKYKIRKIKKMQQNEKQE